MLQKDVQLLYLLLCVLVFFKDDKNIVMKRMFVASFKG